MPGRNGAPSTAPEVPESELFKAKYLAVVEEFVGMGWEPTNENPYPHGKFVNPLPFPVNVPVAFRLLTDKVPVGRPVLVPATIVSPDGERNTSLLPVPNCTLVVVIRLLAITVLAVVPAFVKYVGRVNVCAAVQF